jgi:hypothetical protein
MHGAVARRKSNAVLPSAAKALAALDRLADEIEKAPTLEAVGMGLQTDVCRSFRDNARHDIDKPVL